MSQRDLFIQQYREVQAAKEEENRQLYQEKTEETRKRFIKQFQVEPDEVDGRDLVIDGIKMCAYFSDGRWIWAVENTCPNCGEIVWSPPVWKTWEIGEQLVKFVTDFGHYCKPKPGKEQSRQTWQDRLAEAIAEAIEEMMNR